VLLLLPLVSGSKPRPLKTKGSYLADRQPSRQPKAAAALKARSARSLGPACDLHMLHACPQNDARLHQSHRTSSASRSCRIPAPGSSWKLGVTSAKLPSPPTTSGERAEATCGPSQQVPKERPGPKPVVRIRLAASAVASYVARLSPIFGL
jgi:hypothetical protein